MFRYVLNKSSPAALDEMKKQLEIASNLKQTSIRNLILSENKKKGRKMMQMSSLVLMLEVYNYCA